MGPSWVVEDGEDPVDADYPSSDDGAGAGPGTVVSDRQVSMNAAYHAENSRRRTMKNKSKGSSGYDKKASYNIRIYRGRQLVPYCFDWLGSDSGEINTCVEGWIQSCRMTRTWKRIVCT